jgi:3-oxoacyl-[acyl-carrier-protein] synthase-1
MGRHGATQGRRFMEAGVGWNYVAMDQAIRDAGLEPG